jgi:hypothetical protein
VEGVELRTIAWTQVLAPMALGAAVLGAGTAASAQGPAPAYLWLGLGALAAGVVGCLDESSAAVTAACPRSRTVRLLERLAVPALTAAGWVGFAAAVDGRGGISAPYLALCGVGVLLSALAATALLARLGVTGAASLVGSAALLLVVASVLFQPFPGDLVVLQAARPDGVEAGLWWAASVLSVLVLAATAAEPHWPRTQPSTDVHVTATSA